MTSSGRQGSPLDMRPPAAPLKKISVSIVELRGRLIVESGRPRLHLNPSGRQGPLSGV